jgi:hypothetical protein
MEEGNPGCYLRNMFWRLDPCALHLFACAGTTSPHKIHIICTPKTHTYRRCYLYYLLQVHAQKALRLVVTFGSQSLYYLQDLPLVE